MSAVVPYKGAWSGTSIAHIAALDGNWLRSGPLNLRLTILMSMMSLKRPPFLATQNMPSSPLRPLATVQGTTPASYSLHKKSLYARSDPKSTGSR